MALTLNADSTEWATLAELKKHLGRNVDTAQDSELTLVLEAAHEAVEAHIGPVLWRTVSETVRARSGVVLLRTAPVVSVTALTASLLPVSHVLHAEAGILTVGTEGDLEATYVAGRTLVPAAVRLATLIIAAHLWEQQQRRSRTLPGRDLATVPMVEDQAVPMGFAVPARALELLAPYRRVVIA